MIDSSSLLLYYRSFSNPNLTLMRFTVSTILLYIFLRLSTTPSMASSPLSYVHELTPAKDFWDMKCKIIKVWCQSFRADFIALDEQGSKIQGCVKNHIFPDFETQLKEDNIVVIRKFGVAVQMDKHRVIPLDHKINLFKCTSMTVVEGFTGDPFGFRFNKFTDILDGKKKPPPIVDVIGRLSWCGNLDIFRSHGREHKRLCFDLEDLE